MLTLKDADENVKYGSGANLMLNNLLIRTTNGFECIFQQLSDANIPELM